MRTKKQLGLNPCCNGIWSQTNSELIPDCGKLAVLILVVMEYGLRRMLSGITEQGKQS